MRCLVFAMVLPGLRPFGQTLAQFMICLHRYSLKGSSRSFSRSAVNSSRLSMIHLQYWLKTRGNGTVPLVALVTMHAFSILVQDEQMMPTYSIVRRKPPRTQLTESKHIQTEHHRSANGT